MLRNYAGLDNTFGVDLRTRYRTRRQSNDLHGHQGSNCPNGRQDRPDQLVHYIPGTPRAPIPPLRGLDLRVRRTEKEWIVYEGCCSKFKIRSTPGSVTLAPWHIDPLWNRKSTPSIAAYVVCLGLYGANLARPPNNGPAVA